MRFNTAQYLEKEQVTVSVHNNNSSTAIYDGQPVFYQDYNNATNFGTDVMRYSENSHPEFFAGVAKWGRSAGLNASLASAAVGEVFEAVAYGFTDVIITRRTRANTNATWATMPALTAGYQLIPETVGNNFQTLGPVPATEAVPAGSTGQTVTLPFPLMVVLAESADTLAGQASGWTGASGLADTIRMKAFVRAM